MNARETNTESALRSVVNNFDTGDLVSIVASVLLVYGTGEGQTAKIATRLEEAIEGRHHDITMMDVETLPEEFSVDQFEAVLVGSSIHVNQHHSGIQEFIKTHRDSLEARPTAFFQVSLSSVSDDPERQAIAAEYVDSLLESTGWNPDRIALFGGALRYSKYGFLKRLLMKRIAKDATGDVDTSQDYEYTDWDEVEAFANDFAGFVEQRLDTE